MRVLIVASPGLGHLFPTVPLAQALRAAGHEVRYATGGLSVAASEAGFPVHDATPGLDYAPIFIEQGGGSGPQPIHAEDPEDEMLARLFGRVSSVMVAGVLAAARAFRPHVVVAPPLQGAGPIAAAAAGAPLIDLPVGLYDARTDLPDMVRAAMADTYAEHGMDGAPSAAARISTCLPSFAGLLPAERASAGAWPMRHVPYNGGSLLPEWLSEPRERPRIAVTLGTIEAQWGGIAVLAPLIAAAGAVDAEFAVTLGGGDAELLGPLPPNVTVVEWAPLDILLQQSDAVIHHGGSGTAMTAIHAGIPQCVLPQGSYQHSDVDVLVDRGIAITADAARLGAAECRALLADEGLRKASRDAREEAAAMPAPSAVVPRIAELAGAAEPGAPASREGVQR